MLLVKDLGSIEQHILAAVSKGFQKQMCLPVDAGLVSLTENERGEHNNILALSFASKISLVRVLQPA